MEFVKYSAADAASAVAAGVSGAVMSSDAWNSLVVTLAAVRDALVAPGQPAPRVPYHGPLVALRGTPVPVVGTFPVPDAGSAPASSLHDAALAAQTRAQYAESLSWALDQMNTERRVIANGAPRAASGDAGSLAGYEGVVGLMGDLAPVAVTDPASGVRMPAALGQFIQTLMQGLASVNEAQAALAGGRTVSPAALQSEAQGAALAAQGAALKTKSRAWANLRAVLAFSAFLGGSYLLRR
jgi:hypothetical protein